MGSDSVERRANLSHFDPSQYLISVSGKDYLTVAWRLVWLRAEHPEATIETEMISHDHDRAIFFARVTVQYVDPGTGEIMKASATGHGSETADGFGNYIEKAETKAIGRALAAVGFGTQFAFDFEDANPNDLSSLADSPMSFPQRPHQQQQSRPQPSASTSNGTEATERQMGLINALKRDLRFDTTQLDELSKEVTGVSITNLDRGKASTLIGALKERIRANGPTR